jgi:hypothetical protein
MANADLSHGSSYLHVHVLHAWEASASIFRYICIWTNAILRGETPTSTVVVSPLNTLKFSNLKAEVFYAPYPSRPHTPPPVGPTITSLSERTALVLCILIPTVSDRVQTAEPNMTVTLEVLADSKDDPCNPPSHSPHSVPTWSLSSRLQPSEMAAFSVTSRLLASIVTESLLHAYYIPMHSKEVRGICLILSTHEEHPILTQPLRPADVFAILPLHQEPVCSGTPTRHGRPIWLLDPLDMIPSIFELSTREAELLKYVVNPSESQSGIFAHTYDSRSSKRPFSPVWHVLHGSLGILLF